jgi:glucokinase
LKPAVIGIDIGGTKTLGLIADSKFRVVREEKFKTANAQGRKRFLKSIESVARRLRDVAKQHRLTPVAIGVGCAGDIDERAGIVRHAPNIPWLENLPVKDWLKQRLQLPVVIGNDVQFGTYGEQQLGAARGYDHVLGVFFGTGVGGALILNGRLFTGAFGSAGQVGCLLAHSSVEPRQASVDGTLDRIASKSSIFGTALALASKFWAPYLRRRVGTDLAEMEWSILAASIAAGDHQVEALVRSRLHTAGTILSNVVNFIGPEMVVLGGGLTDDLPQLVVQEIVRGMRPRLVAGLARKVRIVPAKLNNRGVALGAAKIALMESTHA